MKENKFNKKKITYIVIAVSSIVFLIFANVIFNLVNSRDDQPTDYDVELVSTGDMLKAQAQSAMKNLELDKAKDLLNQAKSKYQDEGNTTGVVDIDAMIFVLEHQ